MIDHKHCLDKYFHKQKWTKPMYKVMCTSVDQETKKKTCEVAVFDNDNEIIGTGKNTTKKKAEKEAAMNALVHFGEIIHDECDDFVVHK